MRRMPLMLLGVIFASVFLGKFIPFDIKAIIYAVSLTIKTGITFLLPIIIFCLLFKAAVNLAQHATKIILLVLVAVCCSNFLSTMISHLVGRFIYTFDLSLAAPLGLQELVPAWSFVLPKLIPNDKAMLTGLVLGVFAMKWQGELAKKLSLQFDRIISKILSVLVYIMPVFVVGFIIKLDYEGAVASIAKDYAIVFAVIALAQFIYIAMLYFVVSAGRWRIFLTSLKNMLPAAISGFSTMSSAAAMPLTIVATEKNSPDPDLARAVIPAAVNIHLIGDCFAIPILAYAILKNYGLAEPLLLEYTVFALYFVLAKFSVAAIPGGGIIVMLPILENHLGFNADMLSLITGLYMLFDPVITSANVLGNGAFALIVAKIKSFFD